MKCRHITARFAWHDSNWNGKVCKEPLKNIYCIGSHSLLSSRIQRRRNSEIEERYREKPISEVLEKEKYLPPCYWCINAFGNEKCAIEDPHLFSDFSSDFKDVEMLKDEILEFSIFSWCFKLSFAEEGSQDGRYPADLEKRIERYLETIVPGKSIVFLYANFSNPITGDEHKRLLLGAGIVKEVKLPNRYSFPDHLLKKIRGKNGMQNFPVISWQFRVQIDPEESFLLPYDHYLRLIEKTKDQKERDEIERLLSDAAVSIDERTLYPVFKYVSMQLSHDQALYLLYKLDKSIKKMKEHQKVPQYVLDDISKKLTRIMSNIWQLRGKYPGFRNAVEVLLRKDFGNESEKVAEKNLQ
ncbi:MAG: hypothetical protein QW455_05945 [Archaeoglobaceae archaeon]